MSSQSSQDEDITTPSWKALIAAVIIGTVIGLFLRALIINDKPHTVQDLRPSVYDQAQVRAAVAAWANAMHVEVDGVSCTLWPISECDVHLTNVKQEHLLCDLVGCATREPQ